MPRTRAKAQPGSNLDIALTLVSKFEARYGIDTGIWWAARAPLSEYWSYDGAMWDFPILRGTMFVAPGLRGRALREVVFHEMGHAIASEYDISAFLGVFTRRYASMGFWEWWRYGEDGARFAAQPRATGFVSGYARTTREEDFCETLSCFICGFRAT